MDHHIDLRLWPDPEVPAAQVMGVLFGRLHRALAAGRHDDLGVSFPASAQTRVSAGQASTALHSLGAVLRLHGSAATLDRLMAQPWLGATRDHVQLRPLAPVPADALHHCVRRVQAKSSAERLRRRYARRHGCSEAEARERIGDNAERRLSLPHLALRSASTGQPFLLFIDQGPLQPHAVPGGFNTYGLSQQGATVPVF